MNEIIYENSSSVARKIIEDYRKGVVLLGSQKQKKQTNKVSQINKFNSMYLTLVLCLFIFYYCYFIAGKYTINGFVIMDNKELFKNQQLAFYNTDTQTTTICRTDKDGEFKIRLTQGKYRVYGKGEEISKVNQNAQASLVNLEINSSARYRVTIKK